MEFLILHIVWIKQSLGVTEDYQYTVSIQNAIYDVQLWRVIINGYPYKSIQELGCVTKEEAFTATKQAVYCYIHGNNPDDYTAIGDAGVRTLNALYKILNDAGNSYETQISNNVKIEKESDLFNIDELDKNYVSKIYSIQAGTKITNYTISINAVDGELPEGTKITNIQNEEKSTFESNEKFKILIPIKNLTKEAGFNIYVSTKINNKPVLYGQSPDSSYQDYAITTATYEDASGETQDKYFKNETKLKIIKQDKETKQRLENVEFNIYDCNKKLIYVGLKTDTNGEIKIDNFIPGTYYIQETSSKDGYVVDDKLIDFSVDFNQILTITINNTFEEKKPEIEVTEEKVSTVIEQKLKKLPVTGM